LERRLSALEDELHEIKTCDNDMGGAFPESGCKAGYKKGTKNRRFISAGDCGNFETTCWVKVTGGIKKRGTKKRRYLQKSGRGSSSNKGARELGRATSGQNWGSSTKGSGKKGGMKGAVWIKSAGPWGATTNASFWGKNAVGRDEGEEGYRGEVKKQNGTIESRTGKTVRWSCRGGLKR